MGLISKLFRWKVYLLNNYIITNFHVLYSLFDQIIETSSIKIIFKMFRMVYYAKIKTLFNQ